ncbi:MAG: phosphotransferase [Planctomycetota bacterium]
MVHPANAGGMSAASAAPGGIDPAGPEAHERFGADELAIACSHYELGVIHAVVPFRRGSRRSPKVVLETSRGRLLLKRRAAGQADVGRVTFAHAVIDRLTGRGVPAARLIRTRDGRGCARIGDRLYEMFEFVQGVRYDRSIVATQAAGQTLAALHRAVALSTPPGRPQEGTYHAAAIVRRSLEELAANGDAAAASLGLLYERAGARAADEGFNAWPRQVIHSDFHPGNLVFAAQGDVRRSRVLAVLDFDACRLGPRALDIANGAAQFAVTRSGDRPEAWPVELDRRRLGAFLTGYDTSPDAVLSRAELRALPWMMIEAIIAEAAVPVATTGRFGPIDGSVFLGLVAKKTGWIESHAAELSEL